MAEQPKRYQGKGDIDRYFYQHDKRLQEAFELGTEDEVHQQDGNQQNYRQLSHHLLVREEATREVYLPPVGTVYRLLYLTHQGRCILHLEEAHGYVLAVLAGSNALQVFRRYHLYQMAQRQVVYTALLVGLCLYQGSGQDIVDALLVACNANRQILLVRT